MFLNPVLYSWSYVCQLNEIMVRVKFVTNLLKFLYVKMPYVMFCNNKSEKIAYSIIYSVHFKKYKNLQNINTHLALFVKYKKNVCKIIIKREKMSG